MVLEILLILTNAKMTASCSKYLPIALKMHKRLIEWERSCINQRRICMFFSLLSFSSYLLKHGTLFINNKNNNLTSSIMNMTNNTSTNRANNRTRQMTNSQVTSTNMMTNRGTLLMTILITELTTQNYCWQLTIDIDILHFVFLLHLF